jgi:hypothetical protein
MPISLGGRTKPEEAKFMKKRYLLLGVLLLAGCGTALPPTPKTVQQGIYEAVAAYVSAETAAASFEASRCPQGIAGCTDPIVAQIQAVDNRGYALVQAAAQTAQKWDGKTDLSSVLAVAQNALGQLTAALAAFGVKVGG